MRSLLQNRTLLSFAVAHFCVDLCSGALSVFVVFFAQTLNLSIAQSGLVLGVYTMVSSLTQPLFGYMSDRFGGRWQSSAGLVCIAVFLGLTGYAQSYGLLMALVCLAGVGSAIFHPHGASGARKADPVRKTAAMSVFMLGGNAGYALGPTLAALSMSAMGGRGSLIVLILGLVLAPLVFAYSGRDRVKGVASALQTDSPAAPRFGKLALVALMCVMFFRAWASAATTAYSPVYFPQMAGFTVQGASLLSTVYLLALALGGLIGGIVSDRVGGRTVLMIALLAFGPATFLMFWTRDVNAFWFAPLAGFAAGASWPPLIVMAQDAIPRHSGVASGLALGTAFAMGGIGISVTGYLAEPHVLGLGLVIPLLGVLPLLSAVCALPLPGASIRRMLKSKFISPARA